jgi:hypothetical protein
VVESWLTIQAVKVHARCQYRREPPIRRQKAPRTGRSGRTPGERGAKTTSAPASSPP